MKHLWRFAALAALAIPAMALEGDKGAVVISGDVIKTQIVDLVKAAQAKGSSGTHLYDGPGNFANVQISTRTASGGAEVHAHFDDLFVVQQGTATLVTGGKVVDAKEGANGEIKGTKVEGGVSRDLKPGDVVVIPAGTPHQLIIPPNTSYVALVGKIKE